MRNWRVNTILIIFFIFASIVIGRLFFLQIINHKFYQSQALGQQAGFSEVQGKRGQIYFQNSQESKGESGSGDVKSLAINKDLWILSAGPENIVDKKIFSKKVSEIISVNTEFVFSKIENKQGYTIIKKNLSENEKNKLKELDLEGLVLDFETSRYYPQGELSAHVIGFVNKDGLGQYGIEGYYNDILTGRKGIKEKKTGLNSIGQDGVLSLDGSDIYLTLDYNIQFQAEYLLAEAKKNLDIDAGQIIVIKPDSGRILAMANFPSFDLNFYGKETSMEIFQNSCVQKIFEPGSVQKPLTIAVAINEGKINANTTYTDFGFLNIGPDTIYNYDRKKYGLQTMTGVLEKSINTGAVFAEKSVESDVYLKYLESFGFFGKTEIDLQGEVNSENNILKQKREINLATSSFGQGIEMTPLQLVSAFSTIANGGKLVKPYILEKIVSNNLEKITSPDSGNQVFSKETATEVTTMLISAVDNGFGKGSKVPGYYIAGKTGTAQVPVTNGRGYYSDRTVQSFIGFAPALNPQFLILVKLDNPKVPMSSISATPIFKKLAEYILNYWQIPPDYTK
jgi:cell division protein FtsI (penicillin-binding protein 3)/stage V sporulation protein D (sporulation-specific penicillin-binding protein)